MTTLPARIKQFEGYYERPYWDHKQWSVGYGSRASGPDDVVDRAEAERRLARELEPASRIVDSFAPGLPPGVRDSLVSLTYNAGADWTRAGLGQAVKSGDWATARDRFGQYVKASGQTLPGLVKRRQTELSWWDAPGATGAPQNVAAAPATAAPASPAISAPTEPQAPAGAPSGGLLGPILAELGVTPTAQPQSEPDLPDVKLPASPDLQISYPKMRRVSMPKQALARAAMMRGRMA